MSNTEIEKQQPKFYTTIPISSDEELLAILKKRNGKKHRRCTKSNAGSYRYRTKTVG
jgi:CelD/BcsL family acetyltransferase involved in cellulose biosynthesis